jgi:hypothetical protein
VEKFSEKILLVLLDKKLRTDLETNAHAWAGNFGWGKSSEAFLAVMVDK